MDDFVRHTELVQASGESTPERLQTASLDPNAFGAGRMTSSTMRCMPIGLLLGQPRSRSNGCGAVFAKQIVERNNVGSLYLLPLRQLRG